MAIHSSTFPWGNLIDTGQRRLVHAVARVRHDLVTRPPPDRIRVIASFDRALPTGLAGHL